jgi:hypothetical protein
MKKYLFAALVVVLSAGLASAQTTTGSIYGTVTTAEGLSIEGVQITLTSEHMATRTVMSSARGTFRFGQLDVGNFTVTFEKEGYQKIVREDAMVRMAASTRIEIVMEPSATEQVITITGETALVDLKKTGTSSQLTQDYLANIPSARDPWVILDQLPGITTDRVNIGGAESGQQSNFVSHGASRDQSSFSMDGVTQTDMAALGSSATYYDFDSFEEMQLTTGGADASVQIAGTNINFITKQGSDTFHGQGSAYYTNDSLQGENIPADLEALGYSGNQIDFIKDYGFDVGGPIWKGNIWFWGAYRKQQIALLTLSGTTDTTNLDNYNLKFTGQLGDANRWTFLYTRGEKSKTGRDASPTRPPATTFDQGGPTPIYKIEDTHMLNENLIIGAKFAYVGGGFFLEPEGGRTTFPTLDNITGVWGGSYYYYETMRPQYSFTFTGEQYLDEAFGGSHEIKAGFEYRHTPVTTIQNWGGGLVKVYEYGESAEAWFSSERNEKKVIKRATFYLMDVFNRNRWTFNFGVRYDRQWGNNRPGQAPANPILPALVPALDFPGEPSLFTWNDIVPRIGLTYDLFGDGKTIIRANFSMYADQMGTGDVTYTNPANMRELDYVWTDLNGDDMPQMNELGSLLWWNFNPNSTDPLDTGHAIDPNLEAPRTMEFILGAEREVMPNFSLAANFIYRKLSNFYWNPEDGWSSADYYLAGTITQGGYSGDYYDSDREHSYTYTRVQRPDYNRKYMGIELVATKRLSDRWMANASFNYHDFTEHYDSAASYIDPTNIDRTNGRYYAPITSGSGKTEIWIGSKWSFKSTILYQFPWDINASTFFQYRQGTIWPIRLRSGVRHVGDRAYPLAVPFGDERLDSMFVMDARIEKSFKISDIGRLGIILDIFNLTNAATPLRTDRNVYSASTFGRVYEILNPRVFRFGVRFQF